MLPQHGSVTPIVASEPSAVVKYGPATLFTAGLLEVSTQGTTGAGGSVTSSAHLDSVTALAPDIFGAASMSSTCTVSETGASGSSTITDGTLQISAGNPDVDGDETVVAIPSDPDPNTAFEGSLEGVGDNYRFVFNEQFTGADGSITVNAGHLFLLGPTVQGDVIIGQSVCGVAAASTQGPALSCSRVAPTVGTALRCKAVDAMGIRRIRVIDVRIGAVERSDAFSCAPGRRITITRFRIPDDGRPHRVAITDCGTGARHAFLVTADGAVTPLSGA